MGKIFVFGWQENSWGINFRGHGGMVQSLGIILRYNRYILIFVVYKFSWIKGYHEIHENLYAMKFSTHTVFICMCIHNLIVKKPTTSYLCAKNCSIFSYVASYMYTHIYYVCMYVCVYVCNMLLNHHAAVLYAQMLLYCVVW